MTISCLLPYADFRYCYRFLGLPVVICVLHNMKQFFLFISLKNNRKKPLLMKAVVNSVSINARIESTGC